MESANLSARPTKIADPKVFLDAISITGTGLDSSKSTLDKFPSVNSDTEECWNDTHNTKTDIVVTVVAVIIVAIR